MLLVRAPRSAHNLRAYTTRLITLQELKKFNGVDSPELYICMKGKVYDVTSKDCYYGPGGGYSVFSGHDATLCLATMSLSPKDLNQPLPKLTAQDQKTLDDWVKKYDETYPVVATCPDAPSLSKMDE